MPSDSHKVGVHVDMGVDQSPAQRRCCTLMYRPITLPMCCTTAQPLREPCLVALANRFEGIAAGRVSERDGAVFREFLRAVAPTVLTNPADCRLQSVG